MSEPVKKQTQENPESYSPKTPKIVNMAEDFKNNTIQQNTMTEGKIKVKKIIENATFSSGWEYWFFPSCFASVYMRIEGLTANRQNIITLYAVVSGISHVQFGLTDDEHFVSGVGYNETKVIAEYDDYIKFTMGFAGYSYEQYNKSADKAAVFAAIKESIDADRPVMMNFGTDYCWCVIVGYDNVDGTLYGLDNAGAGGSYWKDKPGTYENGMFVTDHWYEYMTEAVIVTGKTAPTVTYDDVFRRMINIMESMEKSGYIKHSADFLNDNANFVGYDDEKYLELTGRFLTLIALLIDQRAWVSHFFEDISKEEAFKDKAQYLRHIADLYSNSKDVCYIVWNMVGEAGLLENKPEMNQEECAKLMPSPIYRRTIADIIRGIIDNDRRILNCLKEIMGETAY